MCVGEVSGNFFNSHPNISFSNYLDFIILKLFRFVSELSFKAVVEQLDPPHHIYRTTIGQTWYWNYISLVGQIWIENFLEVRETTTRTAPRLDNAERPLERSVQGKELTLCERPNKTFQRCLLKMTSSKYIKLITESSKSYKKLFMLNNTKISIKVCTQAFRSLHQLQSHSIAFGRA